MKQADRVLQYMNDFGSITPLDAVKDLGVMCLAERVRDLRKAGVNVISTPESGLNRYGVKTHYTRYSLAAEDHYKAVRDLRDEIERLNAELARYTGEATA